MVQADFVRAITIIEKWLLTEEVQKSITYQLRTDSSGESLLEGSWDVHLRLLFGE